MVEQRIGGSTNIGMNYVAKAAPDGYTLLVVTDTLTGAEDFLCQRIGPVARRIEPERPTPRRFATRATIRSPASRRSRCWPARDVAQWRDVVRQSGLPVN